MFYISELTDARAAKLHPRPKDLSRPHTAWCSPQGQALVTPTDARTPAEWESPRYTRFYWHIDEPVYERVGRKWELAPGYIECFCGNMRSAFDSGYIGQIR